MKKAIVEDYLMGKGGYAYIRRNRNRFWGSSLDDSKKSVYITTYEVLKGLSLMFAPISSIHLSTKSSLKSI